MSYKILPYSFKQADKLDVEIKPSAKEKNDVFKNGQKIASIGAIGYNDKPTWT